MGRQTASMSPLLPAWTNRVAVDLGRLNAMWLTSLQWISQHATPTHEIAAQNTNITELLFTILSRRPRNGYGLNKRKVITRAICDWLNHRHPYVIITIVSTVWFNSLVPGRCGSNFLTMILKLIIQNYSLRTRSEIAYWWMQPSLADTRSTLVQLMSWCRQSNKPLHEAMLTQICAAIWRH